MVIYINRGINIFEPNEELYNLFPSPNTVRVIKSTRSKIVEHYRIEVGRKTFKSITGALGRCRLERIFYLRNGKYVRLLESMAF